MSSFSTVSGLLLGQKLSVDGCRLSISSSWAPLCPCRAPRVCPPGLEPPSSWGPPHPRARRVGLLQPPEVPGRERERGLGRGRDPERVRGCETLRWGPVWASRALLPGAGRGAVSTRTPIPRDPPAFIYSSQYPTPQRFQASGSPIPSPLVFSRTAPPGLPVFSPEAPPPGPRSLP